MSCVLNPGIKETTMSKVYHFENVGISAIGISFSEINKADNCSVDMLKLLLNCGFSSIHLDSELIEFFGNSDFVSEEINDFITQNSGTGGILFNEDLLTQLSDEEVGCALVAAKYISEQVNYGEDGIPQVAPDYFAADQIAAAQFGKEAVKRSISRITDMYFDYISKDLGEDIDELASIKESLIAEHIQPRLDALV